METCHCTCRSGHCSLFLVDSLILPDGQLSPGVDLVGVVVARVVQVVTDAGGQQDANISLAQRFLQPAAVYEDIHHLGNTEGVPEVVERIVPVVLLDPQQESEQNKLSSTTSTDQHSLKPFQS